MKKTKINMYILSIVTIVAIVGITSLILNNNEMRVVKSDQNTERSLAGEAISISKVSSLRIGSCSDSDGGYTYGEKGTTTGYLTKTSTSKVTKEDHCNDNNEVIEYICYNGVIAAKEYACDNFGSGFSCDDGICTKTSSKITDEKMVCFGNSERGIECLNPYTGAEEKTFEESGGIFTMNDEVFYTYWTDGVGASILYHLNAVDINDNVLWSYELSESLFDPPIVSNDNIFVAGFNYVYSFKKSDGSLAWEYTTTGPEVGSIVIKEDNNKIFYSSTDGYLYSLDVDDGNLLWKYDANPDIEGAWSPKFVESNNIVYLSDINRNLIALDASDGSNLWVYADVYRDPVAVSNNMIYTMEGYSLYAHDIRNGNELWYFDPPHGGSSDSSVIISDEVVYVGFDNYVYALDENDGSELWEYQTEGSVYQQIISGGLIYVGTEDKVYALDVDDGTVLWKYNEGLYHFIMTSPLVLVGNGLDIKPLTRILS